MEVLCNSKAAYGELLKIRGIPAYGNFSTFLLRPLDQLLLPPRSRGHKQTYDAGTLGRHTKPFMVQPCFISPASYSTINPTTLWPQPWFLLQDGALQGHLWHPLPCCFSELSSVPRTANSYTSQPWCHQEESWAFCLLGWVGASPPPTPESGAPRPCLHSCPWAHGWQRGPVQQKLMGCVATATDRAWPHRLRTLRPACLPSATTTRPCWFCPSTVLR